MSVQTPRLHLNARPAFELSAALAMVVVALTTATFVHGIVAAFYGAALLVIVGGLAVSLVRGGHRVQKPLGSEETAAAGVQPEVASGSERRLSQESLLFLSYHDELTRLPNRTYWREQVRMYTDAANERGSSEAGFAVFCVDIDNFKDVNDSVGHDKGDAVLIEAAMRLRGVLRPYDVIGRMGGDEFAILLPDLRELDEIRIVANRVLEVLREPFVIGERTFELGGSIGIAQYPEHGTTVDALLQHSDAALYGAKSDGGNRHRTFSNELTGEQDHRRVMKHALLRALQEEHFHLYYQPLLDLRTGRCDGSEALIRWIDPEKGMIPPGNFINIAEEIDLMPGIGRWVFESAAKQIATWNRSSRHDRKVEVSVNASVKQLQDPDFYAHLYDTLRLSDIDPTQIKLEVTESVALADVSAAKEILTKLRRLGVRTVLDDFGTDYSSLTYLQQLPFDSIKIDMSFVRGLPHNEHDAAIVRSVISLGHDLNRTIVAEGVERREQLEWLRQASCDVIQGYIVERPMPAQRFARWRDVQIPYALAS